MLLVEDKMFTGEIMMIDILRGYWVSGWVLYSPYDMSLMISFPLGGGYGPSHDAGGVGNLLVCYAIWRMVGTIDCGE